MRRWLAGETIPMCRWEFLVFTGIVFAVGVLWGYVLWGAT